MLLLFFFNDTATTEIYTLSLPDALPISRARVRHAQGVGRRRPHREGKGARAAPRQPRRPSGLGIRGRLCGCDVAHAAAAQARRLRGRYGSDALGARAVRAGVRARGARLETTRSSRPAPRAARGSGSAAGRPEQGGTRAGLDAEDELCRSGAHDGGRGPGAAVVKVLVTGADGFVGRWVIRRLLGDGREVYGAVRPGQSPAPVPPAADLTPAEREAVRWLPLELLDADSVRKVVDLPYDAVLHLAAISSGTEATRDPGYAWTVNAAGTARVVQVLAEAKRTGRADPVVLVVSTGEVYGAAPEPRPRRETDPVAPCSPYAASKAGAELAGLEAWHRTGLRVIVARSFAHTGPGQDTRFVVPAFAERLRFAKRVQAPVVKVGNLEPVREFLHVRDVVDAYARLLVRGQPGETYNVASGQGISLEEVFFRLADLIGARPIPEADPELVRGGDIFHLVGDAAKLRAATGWVPRYTLDDTLREVLDAQAD